MNEGKFRSAGDLVTEIVPAYCRVVLAGPGSAPYAAAILAHCPGLRRLYVAAPAPDSQPLPGDSRIVPIPVPDARSAASMLQPFFERDLMLFVEGKVGLFILDESCRAEPDLSLALQQVLRDFTQRTLTHVALHATRGWHMLCNALLNLPHALRARPVSALRDAAQGQPIVLVGAGPSLDDNVHDLAAAKNKAVVIACDAAAATLLKAGVRPDLVVTTDDSERTWRYFAPFCGMLKDTPLVTLITSSWPVVKHYKGPLFFGHNGSACGQAIEKATGAFSLFDSGQCVGHAALELAFLMGGSPVIMIGFDLGYRGRQFHPKDMTLPYFHHDPPPPENLTTVEGNDGQPVTTDLSMAMYLREFECRIARRSTPVWNATGGGARIAGTRVIALAAALDRCAGSPPSSLPLSPGEESRVQHREIREQWIGATNALLKEIEAIVKLGAMPATSGSVPFPFLLNHRPILELISDTENLSEIAAFRFSWEDWVKKPTRRDEDIASLAHQHLSEIAEYSRLVPLTLRMPDAWAAAHAVHPLRAAVYPSSSSTDRSWERIPRLLEAAGYSVEVWQGPFDDIPAIWERQMNGQVAIAISCNGALFPAAWAMPGLVCLEYLSGRPHPGRLAEQWMPGYAAICPDRYVAGSWREQIPADRPVYILDDLGNLCPSGGKASPLSWKHAIERLLEEVRA